jgi:ABC-type molybdate transport system substrate-binding protein
MIRLSSLVLSLALATVLGAAWPAAAAEPTPPLRVLAAGSLKTAFTAVIARWHSVRPDQPVSMENGPAGWLRQRIEQGERYDVYASAALSHAQALHEQGLSGPAVLFARNALCALVKADAPISADTLVQTLLQPTTRIATSTPKADPGGDYVWEYFRRLDRTHPGAYQALTQRAQQRYGAPPDPAKPPPPTASSLISEGQVDVAFGYCSGTRSQRNPALRSLTLPAPAPQADYGLAVSPAAAPAASAFALFVLSPAGQRILAEHGFIAIGLPSQ